MNRLNKLFEDLERLLGSSVEVNSTDRTKTRINDAHLGHVMVTALNDTYSWKRMKDNPHKKAKPELVSSSLRTAENSKNAAFEMLSNGGVEDPAGLLNSYLEKYLNRLKEGVFRYNHSVHQIVFDETTGAGRK